MFMLNPRNVHAHVNAHGATASAYAHTIVYQPGSSALGHTVLYISYKKKNQNTTHWTGK